MPVIKSTGQREKPDQGKHGPQSKAALHRLHMECALTYDEGSATGSRIYLNQGFFWGAASTKGPGRAPVGGSTTVTF